MLTFTSQEFQFLQQYTNEMYQSDTLRTGPMGAMITSIRNKFLVIGPIDLVDTETRFLLFAVNDTFTTSHSPIVTTQLGNSMRLLGDNRRNVISSISQTNISTQDEIAGNYLTEWEVMKNIMTKLGMAPVEPYIPLEFGPMGDPGGISPGIPYTHPPDDGTGYNNT